MMKIAVVTKGNREFGTGHLVRCSRILDALKACNHAPVLYVRMPDEYSTAINNLHHIIKLNQFTAKDLSTEIANEHFNVIIYDALTPDFELIQVLQNHCNRLIILDWQYAKADLKILSIPTIIINGITGQLCTEIGHQQIKNVEHYQGAKFAVLDPEIRRINRLLKPTETKTILVFMGGSDPKGFTLKIVENFTTIFKSISKLPINIQFIIGNCPQTSEVIDLVQELANGEFTNRVSIFHSPVDFLERLGRSNAIITCGGITMFEAVAMGVYPIAMPQVEVQLPSCRQFAEKRIATLVSDKLIFDVSRLTSVVQQYIERQMFDKELPLKLISALDNKGLDRLLDIILSTDVR